MQLCANTLLISQLVKFTFVLTLPNVQTHEMLMKWNNKCMNMSSSALHFWTYFNGSNRRKKLMTQFGRRVLLGTNRNYLAIVTFVLNYFSVITHSHSRFSYFFNAIFDNGVRLCLRKKLEYSRFVVTFHPLLFEFAHLICFFGSIYK